MFYLLTHDCIRSPDPLASTFEGKIHRIGLATDVITLIALLTLATYVMNGTLKGTCLQGAHYALFSVGALWGALTVRNLVIMTKHLCCPPSVY